MRYCDVHPVVRVRPRRVARFVACVVLALPPLGIATGCGPGRPSRYNLRPDVRRPNPGVVLFLVDGLPPRTVAKGCREGWLPNFRERFWEGGLRVRHATTCVPSITYAAIATLKTGVGPATHGIIGNRWFDPDEALFRDYCLIRTYDKVDRDYDTPTIYERIDPRPSATVQTVHRRGADQIIRNWALSGTMWAFRDYTAVDKLAVSSLFRVIGWANRHKRWPDLVTFYLPGLDSVGHVTGPDSAAFRRAAIHADYQFGRLYAWLDRQHLSESTYVILISDHGIAPVNRGGRINLVNLLRTGWGRNVTDRLLQDGPAAPRRRHFERYDTVVNWRDGRQGSIHFRGDAGWQEPPTPGAVAQILASPPTELRLWNQAGIELVAYLASPDEAILRNARGQARITRRTGPTGPEYRYIPVPDDVLGYTADRQLASFIHQGFHADREWLAATATATYPDVVPQLIPLLNLRRAGQVVLFTAPGYSFVKERGGHGGIHRDEMLMTLYIAGPGIEPGSTIEYGRAVDVAPTILDLLDVDADAATLEGVPLLHQRPAAELTNADE